MLFSQIKAVYSKILQYEANKTDVQVAIENLCNQFKVNSRAWLLTNFNRSTNTILGTR